LNKETKRWNVKSVVSGIFLLITEKMLRVIRNMFR